MNPKRPAAFDSFAGAEKLVTLDDDLIQSHADQFDWNEVSDQIHLIKIVTYDAMDFSTMSLICDLVCKANQ